jgi:pimeloyl-ACP methyl ester carboxylesterase
LDVLEYAIAHPAKVKALVLSSTSGTLDRRGSDPSGGATYDAWAKDAEAKTAAASPTASIRRWARRAARVAGAAPSLQSIDEMAGALDKEKVRAGCAAPPAHASTS